MSDYRIQYLPLPNTATQTFIDDNVDTEDQSGDLQTDFRKALVAVLGDAAVPDENKYTLDDLWKLYVQNIVAEDSNAEDGNPAGEGAGDNGYVGGALEHYYSEDYLDNQNGENGFPGGGGFPVGADIETFTGFTNINAVVETDASQGYSANQGCAVSNDGTIILLHSTTFNRIYEYIMGTAWDITSFPDPNDATASLAEPFFDCKYMMLSADGKWVYYARPSTRIGQLPLSTPNDISTGGTQVTLVLVGDSPNIGSQPTGICFDNEGLNAYITDATNDRVHQFSLSTAYDLASRTYVGQSPELQGVVFPSGGDFDGSGTKFYVSDTNNGIHQYNLTTAWDITSLNGTPASELDVDSYTFVMDRTTGTRGIIAYSTSPNLISVP